MNGEDNINDPKSRYLFSPTTALFNDKGYPLQAYVTMSGNKFKGEIIGDWFRFVTLKPASNVLGISYTTHPEFVHRFDLVCYKDKLTYHKPNTPQGIIYYYLVTNDGLGYIPKQYVKEIS